MDNSKIANRTSRLLGRALNFLFLRNPVATSLGLLFGVFAHTVCQALATTVDASLISAIAQIRIWKISLAGVFVFNVPLLPSAFGRAKLPEEIEIQLDLIREVDRREKLPAWQKKQMYMNVIQSVVESSDWPEKDST